jgi:Fe-S oxidoreductase
MAPQRPIPAFAPTTFRQWFAARQKTSGPDCPSVILWADTFNNHFHPRTLVAATGVLERAGYRVDVPRASLCCGRPLYDYGMLDTARRWLEQILETLAPAIEAGTPIVVLEPSCAAVFRDELQQLVPDDRRAARLSGQTFLLSEFLERCDYRYPALRRKAIVHGHCHHKAVMGLDAEERALHALGLDVTVLDSGCCGMAGSFGFERDHYEVSQQVGEQVLLPAIRRAPADALIVADGFSCRTQIAQATNRRAMHLADVLAMASEASANAPRDLPERRYVPDYAQSARGDSLALLLGALLGAGVGFVAARATYNSVRRNVLV